MSFGPCPRGCAVCYHPREHSATKARARAGDKYDAKKPMWDLLPTKAVSAIVDVLTFGAEKYAPDNWRQVPNGKRRYLAAAYRHIVAWHQGEKNDPESGLPHLAHAACCLLFLQELDGDPELKGPTK